MEEVFYTKVPATEDIINTDSGRKLLRFPFSKDYLDPIVAQLSY